MKIVTFNLKFNGAGSQDWSHWVETLDPDILLLQETRAPAAALKPQTVWCHAGDYKWGSAIYVKHGKITPLELGSFEGWLVGAEVEGLAFSRQAGRPLRIFSLHAPPRSVSGLDYPKTVGKMLDVISQHRKDANLVIGGDFNLLSLGERHESELKADGSPWKTIAVEKEIQNRLKDEFGLVNCWQVANPGVPLAQTLRYVKNPVPAYHCDGIFVPEEWGTPDCRVVRNTEMYDKKPAGRRTSDHNPVLATFTA